MHPHSFDFDACQSATRGAASCRSQSSIAKPLPKFVGRDFKRGDHHKSCRTERPECLSAYKRQKGLRKAPETPRLFGEIAERQESPAKPRT